jgi:hypothetical protein
VVVAVAGVRVRVVVGRDEGFLLIAVFVLVAAVVMAAMVVTTHDNTQQQNRGIEM